MSLACLLRVYSKYLDIFPETVTDLVICRMSRQAGSVRGGDDVYLLCEKVNKGENTSLTFVVYI